MHKNETIEMEPSNVLNQLKNISLFTDWKQENKKSFLSHFFSPIDFIQAQKPIWEIGFYDPQEKKVTVFFQNEENTDEFACRAPEKAFQEKNSTVEELLLPVVKISFTEAIKTFTSHIQKEFSQVAVKQGFIILQKLQENTVWNVSGITSAFSVINMKLHAEKGKILDVQQIEVVRGEKGEGKKA